MMIGLFDWRDMAGEFETDSIVIAKEVIDPCSKTALHMEVESRLDLETLLNQLPEKKRMVAQLCRDGVSQSEIAHRMKLSRGRVCQILREIGMLIAGESLSKN